MDGNVVAPPWRLRKLLIGLSICFLAGFVALIAGPITSGALLLLLPNGAPSLEHDLPESYRPFHKGHVDIATGLYVREDEDIVVRGTPAQPGAGAEARDVIFPRVHSRRLRRAAPAGRQIAAHL